MDLKILRKARGWTQKQLGEQSGVDDSIIARVENGEREIGGMGYYSVVRLGRALVPGIPVEHIFPVPSLPTTPPQPTSSTSRTP